MSTFTASQESQTSQSRSPAKAGGGHFSVNVGNAERWLSAAAGGLLAAYGIKRASPLGIVLAAGGGALLYRGVSGHCPAYRRMNTSTAGRSQPTAPEEYFDHGIHVVVSFTINKPRSELFRYWRDFENLPRFMKHLKSVEKLDDKRSHWVAAGPARLAVSWDAEVINEEPDALIAWQSLQGGDVDTAGSIHFNDGPQGRGTEVKVVMDYIPPAGRFGAVVAKLFGRSGEAEVREDLRRFKMMMEAGEMATIEGQPRGSC